jgi:predicted TIM-barrel fold metal-dependent hydrolase
MTTIIDTDSHVIEPPDLWTSRLPASWGTNVMHVKWSEQLEAEAWFIGDTQISPAWLFATYKNQSEFPTPSRTRDEVHPANYDPVERTKVMDRAGISASVLYPNIAGLAFDPFVSNPDPSWALAHLHAYNDFVAEWSEAAPGRFVPMACVPYWDLSQAVKEIERVAERGHRGVVMTGAPQLHDQPHLVSPHWDPMWSACEDAGLSVSFHASNGGQSGEDTTSPEVMAAEGVPAWLSRETTNQFLYNTLQVNDLLFSGILARFPTLKFVSVESGIGWLPFLLDAVDYHFKKNRVERTRPEFGDLLPSDLFRRQVYLNYWFERIEPWHVEKIGADNIMFETDFPHPTCLADDEVQAAVRNGLSDLSTEDREKILWRNAAELYRIDVAP